MTNPETRALRAVLTVTVETRADGIYYVDQADLARHVKGWLEEALCDRDDIEEVSVADAVLPVLLAPADRAAVWREAADDLATAFGDPTAKHIGALGAAHLRRRAREIEAGQSGEEQPETPLEKRLRYSERRNDELRAECKRRGKRVLEQSAKIIALEREIDEVRRQLGAEILRAGQAEAELAAAVSVPPPAPRADNAFVPPAAEGLPPAALDSATEGANALDAWARSPQGRNFLAHALVQLARDGWLRAEPGNGFEPMRDRETTVEPEPAPRADDLREAADIAEEVAESLRKHHEFERSTGALDVMTELRRLAAVSGPCVAGEQQNETPEAEQPRVVRCSRAILSRPHEPHGWYPQPGMDPVDCPGHSFTEAPE